MFFDVKFNVHTIFNLEGSDFIYLYDDKMLMLMKTAIDRTL